MKPEACYKIGFILKPHGLKGQVSILLEEDSPVDFEGIEALFVQTGEEMLPYFIESISLKGSKAFLKLEDVDTLDQARQIMRSSLYLPKTARPKSQRGAFYDDEIIGYFVTDAELGELGTVTEVIKAGPNKLLSVDHGGREVLVPVNGPFIVGVNKREKRIRVTLPEGFLDL